MARAPENPLAPAHAARARGRGALSNRAGRFEPFQREGFDDGWSPQDAPAPALRTTVTRDTSRTVIAWNESPDVPFDRSVNPYRGCEHGCVYCYARPSHAYLGLSPGLDFESRLFAKPDAPERLRAELARPGYRPEVLALGGNTDVYQPLERKLGITRKILLLLQSCRHPVCIITKSALVERDMDILSEMGAMGIARVAISITTLDRELARRMEPRAAAPERRLQTIATLSAAGIPVTVLVAPVMPVLTDHALERILEAAREAGAEHARYVLLRLPGEIRDLYVEWLRAHYPDTCDHALARLREMSGGRDYDPRFGARMRGRGQYAALLAQRLRVACRRLGYGDEPPALDTGRFTPPPPAAGQLALF